MKSEDTRSEEEYGRSNVDESRSTCCGRLKNIIEHVTVEPTAFLIIFASVLQSVAMQTMGLEKACRVNLALDDEICSALRKQNQTEDFSYYEKLVQEFFSKQLVWKSALQTLFPCVVVIFVGRWSDITGKRKAIMLFCLCGEIAQSLNNVINVIFFTQIRLEIYMFFDVFTVGIVGGSHVMFLALINYICDITTEENRTHRIGFVSLCTFSGMPLGLSLSGIILKHGGYYPIFGIALFLHVVNVIYVTFVIFNRARTKEQKMYDGQGVVHFLKTFFNLITVKETLTMLWKKTENNRRKQLIILLATITFLYGTFYGESATLYLSTRFRFKWNEVQYSLFQTYSFLVSLVGAIISFLLFSKRLQWHDTVLGITSTSSKILSSFVYCFAPTATIFYLAPLADMLSGAMVSLLAVRAIYTKLMTPYELGKMASLVALVENMTSLIFVPLYTTIYTATMDTLPGAMFLFGAALTIPALLAFLYLYRMHRVASRKKKLTGTDQQVS